MRCEFLGTGTSHGIPVIACRCDRCRSSDSRDTRLRASLWITEGDPLAPSTSILVDIGPDFRTQALKSSINRLDALLLTHGHADHLNGLDDIRIFSHTGSSAPSADGRARVYPETQGEGLPVYGNTAALADVHRRFSYIFQPVREGGGKPKLHTIDCGAFDEDNPIVMGGLSLIPVPLFHGHLETVGWLVLADYVPGMVRRDGKCRDGGTQGDGLRRDGKDFSGGKEFRGVAYLTDCNRIPDASMELLRRFGPRLDHVVIDGLRPRPHSTHFSYDEALEAALEIGSRHNWLTHICHDMSHRDICRYLEEELARRGRSDFHCQPAHDGLVLEV